MIDICDFAVGLSRQLHGLTIASERPGHRMMETWHPMGVVGVISAFNFPVAVWAWNTALALVCGNAVAWKPSEKPRCAPLPATTCCSRTLDEFAAEQAWPPPTAWSRCCWAGADDELLARLPRVPVVSATGSTRMGRAVAVDVAQRF